MKLAYDSDMKILGGLLTSYTQAIGDSQKEKALKAVQSAYIPFKEKYGEYDAGASTIEGLIGYEEPSDDDDINLEGTEKIEDEGGDTSSNILDLLGGVAAAAPGGSFAVSAARNLPIDDILKTLGVGARNIYENAPTYARMMSGSPIQTKKKGGKIMSKKEMYMQRRKK